MPTILWRRKLAIYLAALLIGCQFVSGLCWAQQREARSNASRDWPFIRGPQFDAYSTETGVLDHWPASGPPVLWARGLGQGYSGFVAREDRIYTQQQIFSGQYVICMDAISGKTLWEYRYDEPYQLAGLYPGPRSTPTLFGNKIYFTGTDGEIGCLTENGKLVWSVKMYETFGGTAPDFGYACSPVVEDGLVILPVGAPGASIVALDAESGQTIWKSGDDKASYSPVMPLTLNGERLIVGYLQNALVGHDLRTGKKLWRVKLSTDYDEHSAWPLYREPYLWISGPFRKGSQLLDLSQIVDGVPHIVWDSNLMSNDVLSSILVADHIYGFDLKDIQAKAHRASRGAFRCLEFATGKESWSTTEIGHASILFADNKLVLLNDVGELMLIAASPERYELLAKCTLIGGEIGWTPPLLHRGRLYARNHSRAICVYLGNPDDLQKTSAPVSPKNLTEISPAQFRDWTYLLGVEPQYAMDVPAWAALRSWYFANVCFILFPAGVFAWLVGMWRPLGNLGYKIFATTGFLLGMVGTTALSIWRNDFTFTWMIPLFISFDACVRQIAATASRPIRSTFSERWQQRLIGLFFLVTCAAYFWLCRRLSLPTEWAFLVGFPAMLPVAYFGHHWAKTSRFPRLLAALNAWFSFSIFYWSAIGLLMLRYEIPD